MITARKLSTCGYGCHVIGGPFISENPACPEHGGNPDMTCPLCGKKPTVTTNDEGDPDELTPQWRFHGVVSCCQLGSQHWASTHEEATAGAEAAWHKYYQGLVFPEHPLKDLVCFQCGNPDIRAYFEDRAAPWRSPDAKLPFWEMACEKCDRAERAGVPDIVGALTKLAARWAKYVAARAESRHSWSGV